MNVVIPAGDTRVLVDSDFRITKTLLTRDTLEYEDIIEVEEIPSNTKGRKYLEIADKLDVDLVITLAKRKKILGIF